MKFTTLHDDEKLTDLNELKRNPALGHLFLVIEAQAFSRAIGAAMTDHETRAAACAEVRAIRSFKTSLMEAINDAEMAIKKSRA